jgi:probable FeS assembly SUF system protein SufT
MCMGTSFRRCWLNQTLAEAAASTLELELGVSPSARHIPAMSAGTTVKLSRDCAAIQIPVGTEVTLKAATPVDIVQTLGGTYTVHSMGGLFRISGKDADALGLTPEPATSAPAPQTVSEQAVWSVLKTCFDPEIPVNIVDLGLVYDMGLEPLPTGGQKVFVKMTLTAPGCGMGPTIARDAQQKIIALNGVEDASVEVVWDPPWHQSMISAEGRKILGLG